MMEFTFGALLETLRLNSTTNKELKMFPNNKTKDLVQLVVTNPREAC